MKIEIGESIIASWLRHIIDCRMIQTNWKASPTWDIFNYEKIEKLKVSVDEEFDRYGLDIFKNSSGIDQILAQAEIDVIGISYDEDEATIHCVDIAFHESGVNYGSRTETVSRILKKIIRTAMCIEAYFTIPKVCIYFATPKTGSSINDDLQKHIGLVGALLKSNKFSAQIDFITNERFNSEIIQSLDNVMDCISDTNELYLRSIQLHNMVESSFERNEIKSNRRIEDNIDDSWNKMKIGAIARNVLMPLLESCKISRSELDQLQDIEYSKKAFGIQFPLLRKVNSAKDRKVERYYKKSIKINTEEFVVCSEWFETAANNDRPQLIKWIKNKRQLTNGEADSAVVL